MRSKAKTATRLALYVGLLSLEVSLVLGFYILPQFEARNAPDGHWEMETPLNNASPVVWIGLVAFLGLVLLGNIGVVVRIWRAAKDLTAKDA